MSEEKRGARSRRRLLIRIKHAEALRLRADEGLSYEEVAARLGYSNASGAFKAVEAALAALTREPAEHYREMQLRRYERLLAPHLREEHLGDVRHTDAAVRVLRRIDRIMGLERLSIEDIEPYLRERARAEGLDSEATEQAVRDAQQIVRDHARDWGVR